MNCINDISVLDKMPWLPVQRKRHIISTAATAKRLARLYCEKQAQEAFCAGLYHDCAKGLERELMVKYRGEAEMFADYPGTLHAPLGACLARDMFMLEDPSVISAIKWHCTGRAKMTELEKIVFLADAIEPLREYDAVDLIRGKVYDSLNSGILAYLGNLLEYLKKNNQSINPYTIECYAYFRSINE